MDHDGYEITKQMEESKIANSPAYSSEQCTSGPKFSKPLSSPQPVSEGGNIHLECRLEPTGDPTMRVEWYCDGRVLSIGSRFKTYNDFGYVALDIIHATVEDAGEYTVHAANQLGSATASAFVRVIGDSDIVTDSQHQQSLKKIQQLEDSSRYRKQVSDDVGVAHAPQFTKSLHDLETGEGSNVHMECRLQPVGDPTMKVEWFVNGVPIKTGHRFKPAYDFDYISLDLLGVYPEDSGVYTCQARNALGEAVTSCSVKIVGKQDLLLDSQNPAGLRRIQHLEDSAHHKRTEMVDEQVTSKPRFVTKPKNVENATEGKHAHFECKIEPTNDSNLKVEWYKNGCPLMVGHRFRLIHDFGHVALDIVDLIAEDSGEYTCRATNHLGVDEVTCILNCTKSKEIITSTQNEIGLQKIQHLEDRSAYHRTEQLEETCTQAPDFTTPLEGVVIKEGQRAHLACRLVPSSDPTMKVQWLYNGQPLKSGSRFTETNSFGFVALDILYTYPEDSGMYSCRATNELGEVESSAEIIVQAEKSFYDSSKTTQKTSTQQTVTVEKTQHLEDSASSKRNEFVDQKVTVKPKFVSKPKNLENAVEGQQAYFDCKIEPLSDPNLKVEWFKNGRPLTIGNRFRLIKDFGHVALNIINLVAEDSGQYTCRATNSIGVEEVTFTLKCTKTRQTITTTQNQTGLQQIQNENRSQYHTEQVKSTTNQSQIQTTSSNNTNKNSTFVQPRSSQQFEDQSQFHKTEQFTTQVTTQGQKDSKFVQPKSIQNTEDQSRFNRTEQIQKTTIQNPVSTTSSKNINKNTQVDNQSSYCKTQQVKETSTQGPIIKTTIKNTDKNSKFTESRPNQQIHEQTTYYRTEEVTETTFQGPVITKTYQNIDKRSNVVQQQEHSQYNKSEQVTQTNTQGPIFTSLQKTYGDSNVTEPRSTQKLENQSSYRRTDQVKQTTTQAPFSPSQAPFSPGQAPFSPGQAPFSPSQAPFSPNSAQNIERQYKVVEPQTPINELCTSKPIFAVPLTDPQPVPEGGKVHLECRLEPMGDPTMRVEWFCNGRPVTVGSRIKTTNDFGFVALDILSVTSVDAGTYTCQARNQLGITETTCCIKVIIKKDLQYDTQYPAGLEKIQQLEESSRYKRTESVEQQVSVKPRFVTKPKNVENAIEGKQAHFDCKVEPITDPNLKVEWYKNGRPLMVGHRFRPMYDFGHVALDISDLFAEDSGEYTCRATNLVGIDEVSCTLTCTKTGQIITSTQNQSGLQQIQNLENRSRHQNTEEYEEIITSESPEFTKTLKSVEIKEGQQAHFECRLIPLSDPSMKVEWFHNGQPLKSGSRFTETNSFGFVALDILQTQAEDSGTYSCKASSEWGEAETSAMCIVHAVKSIYRTSAQDSGMRVFN